MAKKKYQNNAEVDQEKTTQQEGGQPMNLQTMLLGVIAVVLVVQTFLLLTDDGGTPAYVPSGTAAAPAAPLNNMNAQPAPPPPAPQPANNSAGNINVTMPNQQATQPQTAPAANTTTASFSESTKDFGAVSRSAAPMTHTFTVTNNGAQPLTYTNVRGDAGASVTSYPTTPIPPGGSGQVSIQFDPSTAKGSGIQSWNIHLDGNTNPGHQHLVVQATIQD